MHLFRFPVLVAVACRAVTASPTLLSRVTATTVNNDVVSSLRYWAQWAAASYCSTNTVPGSRVTCGPGFCPTVEGEDTNIVASFTGKATDLEGFVATDASRGLIVVSFKGSSSAQNWITDFVFNQVPCSLVAGCLIHAGFDTAYNEVQAQMLAGVQSAKAANPSYNLVITGHSLGGAVATLAGAYLRVAGYPCDVYTYGSPRVGNDPFAQFVTAQAGANYRVTHLDDPVPRLPPIVLDYAHTSPEFWLRDGNATTTSYGVQDIKVCTGTTSIGCNAGTLAFDGNAHNYYFQHIDGCTNGTTSKRDLDSVPQETIDKCVQYAALDQQAVANDTEAGAERR